MRHTLARLARGFFPRRCPDTGLTDAEQQARQEAARQWARQWNARVNALMQETGCSLIEAARAIDAADAREVQR